MPDPSNGTIGSVLRLPWTLALAHLRRRRTQNLLSMLGVAVGVMVLTTALSLTNGFVSALIDTTIRALPHLDLQVWGASAGTVTKPDAKLETVLSEHPDVLGFSPYTVTKGVLTRRASSGRGGMTDFAIVYGVNPGLEAEALNLLPATKRLLATLPEDGMLLGDALADNLGARAGDQLFVVTASGLDVTGVKRKAFRLVGTFRTGNYLVDAQVGFVPLAPLQELRATPNQIVGYHVKLRDPELAPRLASQFSNATEFSGRPWQDQNALLIEQMKLQKTVIGAVLLLMVIVAIAGMVNVLVLTVFEKTPEIAILRAMGASARAIQLTFLLEGLVLGVGGLVLGNLLGVLVSAYFQANPFPIPGGLYFITALPAKMRLSDFVWVSAASLVAVVLATLLPARRAAGIEPAKIIR